MVLRKKHKIRRQRRTRVCGYGRVSGGHRKSGRRGGCGAAGRKQHHKIWYHKEGIGKTDFGFVSHPMIAPPKVVNVKFLDEYATQLGTKDGDSYNIDLNSIQIQKLLGTGKVTQKLHITVNLASKGAIEKIEQAGGKVILPEKDE